MEVIRKIYGELENNCYIIYDQDGGEAYIIDPGYEAAKIRRYRHPKTLSGKGNSGHTRPRRPHRRLRGTEKKTEYPGLHEPPGRKTLQRHDRHLPERRRYIDAGRGSLPRHRNAGTHFRQHFLSLPRFPALSLRGIRCFLPIRDMSSSKPALRRTWKNR